VREEDEAGAVRTGGRKRDAERRGDLPQEAVGHLHQNAGAVAGVRFAAAGAAMLEIAKKLKSLGDNRMRSLPFEMHDEANAAGGLLVLGIVQALTRWGRLRAGMTLLAVFRHGLSLVRARPDGRDTFAAAQE
jgi:hypothetical protein